MTVEVMVLVILPTRKWSSTVGGSFWPIVAVPKVPVHAPCDGEEIRRTAPGITLAVIAAVIFSCTTAAYAGSLGAAAEVAAGAVEAVGLGALQAVNTVSAQTVASAAAFVVNRITPPMSMASGVGREPATDGGTQTESPTCWVMRSEYR